MAWHGIEMKWSHSKGHDIAIVAVKPGITIGQGKAVNNLIVVVIRSIYAAELLLLTIMKYISHDIRITSRPVLISILANLTHLQNFTEFTECHHTISQNVITLTLMITMPPSAKTSHKSDSWPPEIKKKT